MLPPMASLTSFEVWPNACSFCFLNLSYVYDFHRYVVEKDTKYNAVFVSRNYFTVDKRRRLFRVGSLKWLTGGPPTDISQLRCKVNSLTLFHMSVMCSSRPWYMDLLEN